MEEKKAGSGFNDRRSFQRASVYSFLHATALVLPADSAKQSDQTEQQECCTGLVVDISPKGAQFALPVGCEKYLKEGLDVTVRIGTTFIEEVEINTAAKVVYVQSGQNHGGMQVGVQFAGLDMNLRAKTAIEKICEYGDKLKTAVPT